MRLIVNHGREATTSEGQVTMNTDRVRGRPGRPRVIGDNVIPKIVSLYRSGLGYRATARELAKEGLWVDWSTVRRAIKAQQGRSNENIAPGDF
jgi:hypothetical protein